MSRSSEEFAIAERRKNVSLRYLRGQTQCEIAYALEVDQATVSRDLKAIQREWMAASVQDRAEWLARELATIDEVERTAWNAFSRSQENAQSRKVRRKAADGSDEEIEETTRGQAGESRFLSIILGCIDKRCKLLGLDAPTELVVHGIEYKTIVAVLPPGESSIEGSVVD